MCIRDRLNPQDDEMRRLTFCTLLGFLLVPVTVEAQPRLMFGGGLSSPYSDFGEGAEAGWHGMAGLQLEVPGIPIAIRADAAHHSFGEMEASGVTERTTLLTGAISGVLTLPGIGIGPYLLGGLGVSRNKTDLIISALSASGSTTRSDPSFHLGAGVTLGALGFGGFAEIRGTQASSGMGSSLRFLAATVGIRL